MRDARIAIVGGGIVGASVAYYLSQRTTVPVVVYERNELAGATTARSTAMIGVGGPEPYYRLKAYGFRLYNEFFADRRAGPRYRGAGRLRVATSEGGARRLASIADGSGVADGDTRIDASTVANSPVEYVPGDELQDRFLLPPLDTGPIEGALHRPQHGYITDESRTMGSRELAMEFVERAREGGVRFETGTEVTDIVAADGRVTGISTSGAGVTEVGAVVCAAGPWNRTIAGFAGLDLPVELALSPVFALDLDEPLPYSLPMIKSHDPAVGIHPKREDRMLVTYTPEGDGSVADPSGVADTAPDEIRETALRRAEELVPLLEDADLVDEWVGIGTSLPDGGPIVGWTDRPGLALAATRSGIQYAPAVGSIVARQLVDREPTEFYDAVSISRFDGYSARRPSPDADD